MTSLVNIARWNAGRQHVGTFLVFYIACLCILFTVAVYYPGFMSYDSVAQLREARGSVVDNQQPPLMSYMWRVLDHVIPGPAGMLILQAGLYWLAWAWIVQLTAASNLVRVPVMLLFGFLPPLFGLVGTIWKDVGMNSFLMMGVVCFLLAERRRRLRYLAWANFFLFLAGSFRHNALVACVPLVVLDVWIAWRILRERYPQVEARLQSLGLRPFSVAAMLGANLVLLAGPVMFVNSYGVVEAHIWSFMAIHDLVGMSVYQGKNLLPDDITKENQLTIEDLKGMYVGHNIGSLYQAGSRRFLGSPDTISTKVISHHGDPDNLFRTWEIAILDHPGSYLWHRAHVIQKLMVLEAGKPWYPFNVGIESNPWNIQYVPSAMDGSVIAGLQFAANSTYLYSAWIYHLLLVIVAVIAPLLPWRHRWLMAALALSALLYTLTNFIFAPAGDFRYDIWGITAACLCCTLALGGFTIDSGGGGSARKQGLSDSRAH